MRRFIILLLCCLWLGATLTAQQLDVPTLTTPRLITGLYVGPGITYERLTMLLPGQLVNITERNSIGTWLHVRQVRDDGTMPIDGWVEFSAMELRPELDIFSMVTENRTLLDGDAARVSNPLEAVLYQFPILPRLSEAVQAVYARGQVLGRSPSTVTRAGDSLLNSQWYLMPMRGTDDRLGRYGYLQTDMRFFGPTMRFSVAVQKGLSTYTVHDPLYAEANCRPNETPLTCEYRLANPLAAFIMFGPNDLIINKPEDYRTNLVDIVEQSLDLGVIPVLMTFSSHPNHPLYVRSLEYNVIITEIATLYDVPLINVWVAARNLPEYGLEGDLIHLKNSGFRFINFENNLTGRSGVALLNLLSLRFMHDLRTTLDIPLPPALTATPVPALTPRPTNLPPISLSSPVPVYTSTPRP